MPFSTEEKALLSLTPVQRYGLRFFASGLQLAYPLKKNPAPPLVLENVTTVDELVSLLSQEGQTQTHIVQNARCPKKRV